MKTELGHNIPCLNTQTQRNRGDRGGENRNCFGVSCGVRGGPRALTSHFLAPNAPGGAKWEFWDF